MMPGLIVAVTQLYSSCGRASDDGADDEGACAASKPRATLVGEQQPAPISFPSASSTLMSYMTSPPLAASFPRFGQRIGGCESSRLRGLAGSGAR